MPIKKFVIDNEYYLFPENAFAVDRDRPVVYVDGRPLDSVEPYRVTEAAYKSKRVFEYLVPAPADGFISGQYEVVRDFLKRRPCMSYLQFDSAACQDMILFSFMPGLDLAAIDTLIERLQKAMPYIMNIFLRPVIHLHSEDRIVPVEAVKKIDQRTVQHILQHSEHWKTLEQTGKIRPARLLTTLYEDDYTIYENRVFCRTMDQVVALLKRYKQIFTDIIYNKISFEMSVGDKTNHLYHYLALGKLYVGFVKSDELFAERCGGYNEAFDRFIGRIVSQRVRPVYKKNRRLPIGNTLRKTNILAMHKDYRHIYRLKRMLDRREEAAAPKNIPAALADFAADYSHFCNMLTVFSVAHFRFTSDERPCFENGTFLGAAFAFQKWSLVLTPQKIRRLRLNATVLRVGAGKQKHTTLLIPYPAKIGAETALLDGLLRDIRKEHPCDNYIFFTPETSVRIPTYFSNTPVSFGILPLSVNDINSFKRIQKLVLIAMVKTDTAHDTCPFCGGRFEKEADMYVCKTCKTELSEPVCPHCKKPFLHTSARYPHLKNKIVDLQSYGLEAHWKYCRDKDAQLNYRNITALTDHGAPLCPHCNKG